MVSRFGRSGATRFFKHGRKSPRTFYHRTSSIPEIQNRSQPVYVWLLIVVVCPIRGQRASASGRWTYLPDQGDKSITQDWQRSTPTCDARYQHFFTNFPSMLLRYLQMVQRITSEILVDILNDLPWICVENEFFFYLK